MILVTGGTGFVGSAVVRELTARGGRVAVLGRDAGKIEKLFENMDVEPREADVTDAQTLGPAFAGIDTVISAVQFPNSPIENRRKGWTFEQVDFEGTCRQLEAARAAGVSRFVYVSGVGAAADAEKHWFRFKWLAEDAVRGSGIPSVIIRPTWVYGPDDVALNRFLGFARRLPFVPMIGDGKQLMQPIFVDDLARLLAEASERPEAQSRTFEAGGPETLPMNAVIETALDVAGMRRPIIHQPVWLGKTMAGVLKLLPGPPLTPDAIDFITHEATADNTEVDRVFRPNLTGLRDGLGSYLTNPMEATVEA